MKAVSSGLILANLRPQQGAWAVDVGAFDDSELATPGSPKADNPLRLLLFGRQRRISGSESDNAATVPRGPQ